MTTTSSVGTSGSTITFSGLASGLDTASIISSLMEIASEPQTQLEATVATEQGQVAELQSINSTLASLGTAADSFLTGSTWTQQTATTSDSRFSVTASSTAAHASVSVSVTQSATTSSALMSASALSGVTAGSTYTITNGSGTPTTFTVGGTGSLSDIASAINATSNSGVTAVVINPNGSSPTLELVSTATGANSNFSLTDANGATLVDTSSASSTPGVTTNAGVDAQLSVDGVAMSSASNTVTILSGVQLTIPTGISASGTPTTATVSVSDDGSSRANALSTFVQQINSLLTTISKDTAYGTITAGSAAAGAGVLAGNADLRDIANQLVNTIFASSNSVSLGNMGLSVDTDGQLTFDSATFEAAYQADPDAVQDAFTGTDGFISRVKTVSTQASDSYDGTLTASITAMNSQIDDQNDQIAQWTDRLAMKQQTLETQYANLETKLATLQSQANWLTSEISGLVGNSSSSSSNS